VRRELEMRAQTGWNRLVLLMFLLVLTGCQAIAAEPVASFPTPEVKVEPSKTFLSAESTPARDRKGKDAVTITVVYDNNPYDPRLQTAWGFGCLVEIGEKTIHFDTGGCGVTLLRNMVTMGIEPTSIDTIVLSHIHADHTGGLNSLFAMGVRPTIYILRSFPPEFKSQLRDYAELVEVQQSTNIANGINSTGEMGTGIVEQALVLNTPKGLVVVTGCAHPGISEIVSWAKEIGGDEIYLVLGGFHLSGTSEARIKEIIVDFQRLGVQKVAPCHCTGDKAIALLREAYGENFIQNGVGQVTEIIYEE
jgi:7,8-dihydropterin-6-yl-methyl-4-(beta-D-ribofuranosyl)aminobenzene 5'-phosphate synthase